MVKRPRFVDAFELARSFRLPESWLLRQANAGRIPSLRIGRSYVRFDAGKVKECLARMAAEGMHFPRPTSADPLPTEGNADER